MAHFTIKDGHLDPESLKAVILLCDIVNGFIDRIGNVVNTTAANQFATLPSIIFPGIIFVVFGIIYVIYTIVWVILKKEGCRTIIYRIILGCSLFIGSICYFIGDNISKITENFGRSGEFIARVSSTRTALLVLAIVLYRVIPYGTKKLFNDTKEERTTEREHQSKVAHEEGQHDKAVKQRSSTGVTEALTSGRHYSRDERTERSKSDSQDDTEIGPCSSSDTSPMVTARQGGRRQTSEQVTVTVDVHLNKDTITDSEAKRVDDGGKHGRDNPDLEDTAVSDKRSEDDAGRVLIQPEVQDDSIGVTEATMSDRRDSLDHEDIATSDKRKLLSGDDGEAVLVRSKDENICQLYLMIILEEVATAAALTVDLEIYFTTVTVSTTLCTSTIELVFTWGLLALMALGYTIFLLISIMVRTSTVTVMSRNYQSTSKKKSSIYYCTGIIIVLCFGVLNGMYLIIDNMKPLHCFVENERIDIMRLFFYCLTLIVYGVPLVIYTSLYNIRKCKNHKEKTNRVENTFGMT